MGLRMENAPVLGHGTQSQNPTTPRQSFSPWAQDQAPNACSPVCLWSELWPHPCLYRCLRTRPISSSPWSPSRPDVRPSSTSSASGSRATRAMGSQTVSSVSSSVSRGHLISCTIVLPFLLMLNEGIELGSLRSSSALKFSSSEN